MRNLRLIQGNRPGLSTAERISAMLKQLDHHNKTTCFYSIMQLDLSKQIMFLTSYLLALEALPEVVTPLPWANLAQTI